MVELLSDGQEAFRSALLDAARDPEARVRVAAIGGLARLGRDDTTESILRSAWNNAREAYGARGAALRGLVGWKVEDAQALLEAALKIPADHHRIAAGRFRSCWRPRARNRASSRRCIADTGNPPRCVPRPSVP